jgi:hypothetical protein
MDDPEFRRGDELVLPLRGRPPQPVRVAEVFPAGLLLVAPDGAAELVSHQRVAAERPRASINGPSGDSEAQSQ